MKTVAPLLAALLLYPGAATAGSSYIADGLFCIARADIAETFRQLGSGAPMVQALALVNRDELTCVWADRVGYMVTSPSIVDGIVHDGVWHRIYEANLVGVLVGGNPRPVDPPVRIYFVPTEILPGSILAGET